MCLSKAVSVSFFFVAFGIGVVAVYVTSERPVEAVSVDVSYQLATAPEARTVSMRTKDLVGVWKGTWGHGRESCKIEIKRIDGDKFYGTLYKEGAVIALAGEFDPEEQRVFFREIRVNKLGPEMSEWSLGTNTGTFSPDGRTVTGTGIDKWGTYGWDATKD